MCFVVPLNELNELLVIPFENKFFTDQSIRIFAVPSKMSMNIRKGLMQ